MLLLGPIHLAGEDATAALAARLAPRLGGGDALLLSGPLGAGKSTFARALVRARLGDPDADVPSPTYTLVQTYDAGRDTIWHADLYRLTDPREADELGLVDAFADAICLVEWPERLGPLAPVAALHLQLALGEAALGGAVGHGAGTDATRRATFSGPEDWGPRLRGLDGP